MTDDQLIDNAATASQNASLIDDKVTREAIKLNVIAPLRALLSAPKPEAAPVAWMHPEAGWACENWQRVRIHCRNDGPMPIPLYAHPPKPALSFDDGVRAASELFITDRSEPVDDLTALVREANRQSILNLIGSKPEATEGGAHEKAAEKERLRFEGDLDKWMKTIGAGITGYQPEAYAVMDIACSELVKLRKENAEQKGWQPMETAPLDGKHCILAVKEGAFFYSVQGAYQAGQWNAVHRDNVKPLFWMPNVRLPEYVLGHQDDNIITSRSTNEKPEQTDGMEE